MRICLIAVEIFAWGKYGGFGKATRLIGRELAARGHEVFAVVPRRRGQRPVEQLDGITVLGFSPWAPWTAKRLFAACNADIYHSCEASFGTWLAQEAMPHRKHLITFRDPRDWRDWRMEFALPSLNKLQVLHNFLYESGPLVARAVRRADALYAIARYLLPKVRAMYGLSREPEFLPTPVAVPEQVEKASAPTVCYVARFDRRKRPELFLDLARQFPEARFIALGKSRDASYDASLRRRYAGLPNLQMLGFVDQFASDLHSRVLGQSWIMVNTATREAFPNAFLEAAAHRCAVLTGVNTDGMASRYGHLASDDDFAAGLRWLLEADRWRTQGQAGYEYVNATFERSRAIDRHLEAYQAVLNGPHARREG